MASLDVQAACGVMQSGALMHFKWKRAQQQFEMLVN